MARRTQVKVIDVIQQGEIITLALQPERYEEQREWFEEYVGIKLPQRRDIPFNNQQLFRVLMSDVEVIIRTEEETFGYILKQGMITDFASIPRFLRGSILLRVDNDDPRILIPSLVHDAGCSFKLLGSDKKSFTKNNELFQSMCRFYGFSRYQSRVLNMGVQSPVGWSLWKNGRGYEKVVRASVEIEKRIL